MLNQPTTVQPALWASIPPTTPAAVPTGKPYRLLICGSHTALNPALIATARQAVVRAHQLHFAILVGDAPGIDHLVIQACHALGVTYACVYPQDKPCRIPQARLKVKAPVNGYAARDRWMVQQADRVLAIWNGSSRDTQATYTYAIQQGKPAHLLQPRPQPQPSQTLAAVKVILTTHGGPHGLTGEVALVGLDAQGHILKATHQPHVPLRSLNINVARLETLVLALQALAKRRAGLAIQVIQSSAFVEDWCLHGMKRPSAASRALLEQYRALQQQFATVTVSHTDRQKVTDWLRTITQDTPAYVH